MNVPLSFRFRLQSDSVTGYLTGLKNSLRGSAQRRIAMVMAREFYQITRSNIGTTGTDRPTSWPPLSESYKKQLKRKSFGTPLIPTELRAGTLRASITMQALANSAVVYSDNPYIAAQQFGYSPKRIPARPFFPISRDGQLTPSAAGKLIAAANLEAEKLIAGI